MFAIVGTNPAQPVAVGGGVLGVCPQAKVTTVEVCDNTARESPGGGR
jgi:hypothetical protein